ncbi:MULTISPECIES: RNA polymerase sigma factor [Actinomadura]|uniref:RNA polymerase sigma factor n=1 Tax=Actinomadura yumaensis TaxID=111807 RepID=A0ABW2CKC9_9ACTN|nr:RNA polymerase sigma factor [Actinomadura sp. J1-007]MWK36898.1 sigma-70 family RNA polymerase sigma factor [Actinomadura sp. J1-007]
MALPARAEELATQAAAGDPAALEELLREIRPEVLRRCVRFLPCEQDAEEAAQDALLLVARKITTFEGRSRFGTWLHTVVTNCARKTYADLKRRQADPLTEAHTNTRPDPRTTSVIAGSRIDLLDSLERLERAHPGLVAPVVYRDVCQMEYAEIVELLGLNLGTVKSRLHRGRQYLQQWLRETP